MKNCNIDPIDPFFWGGGGGEGAIVLDFFELLFVFICVPTKFPMCYHKVLNGFPNLFPKMFPIPIQFVPHAFPNIILLEPMKERGCSIIAHLEW